MQRRRRKLAHPAHPADVKLISRGSFVEATDQTGSQGPLSGAGSASAHRSVKFTITGLQCSAKPKSAPATIHSVSKKQQELARLLLQCSVQTFRRIVASGEFSRILNDPAAETVQ